MLIVSYITHTAILLSQLQFALLMFGTSDMVGNDAVFQRNFSACRAEQLPCRNLQAIIRDSCTLATGVTDFGLVEQEGFFVQLFEGPGSL